jgi:hypothetical protein
MCFNIRVPCNLCWPLILAVSFYARAEPHMLKSPSDPDSGNARLIVANAPVVIVELNPVADTALRNTTPNNNFGAAVDLPVGVAIPPATPRNRVLLKFNLEELPEDAIILSATLRLFVVQTGTAPASFGLHRALQDWGEGRKAPILQGAPATENEATWNARFHPGTLWGSGGGQAGTDYVETASATGSLAGSGSTGQFTSEQLVADLHLWLAEPGANFGWFLMAVNEPPSTGKRIGSRENTNPEARPLLIIEYTGPEMPEPPTLFDPASIENKFRFSFHAEANRAYAVEFRESLNGGDWNVLSEIPGQTSSSTLHFTNTISSAEGYFRVRTP